jgi:hypothetical protein
MFEDTYFRGDVKLGVCLRSADGNLVSVLGPVESGAEVG